MGRARLEGARRALPGIARLPAEAQRARRKQRHANDLVEVRLVPMPADSCAGPIFVDEYLEERVFGTAEFLGDLASEGKKKRREWYGFNDSATVVVVAVAEAHYLPVRQIAVKVARLERELSEIAREALLLFDGQDVRAIPEPFR